MNYNIKLHPFQSSINCNSVKKKVLNLLFLIASLSLCQSISAQERFKLALVGGFNLSQLDGDNFSGYDKFGLSTGVRATTVLHPRYHIDFELLYSGRGSFSGNSSPGFTTHPHYFVVTLDYAEIPISGKYLWKKIEKKRGRKKREIFYRYALHGGVSIGRLINVKINEETNTTALDPRIAEKIIPFKSIEDKIIRSDVGSFIGISYYFTKHIGLTLRHSISLTPLYLPSKNNDIGAKMRNYYLTTLAFYEF